MPAVTRAEAAWAARCRAAPPPLATPVRFAALSCSICSAAASASAHPSIPPWPPHVAVPAGKLPRLPHCAARPAARPGSHVMTHRCHHRRGGLRFELSWRGLGVGGLVGMGPSRGRMRPWSDRVWTGGCAPLLLHPHAFHCTIAPISAARSPNTHAMATVKKAAGRAGPPVAPKSELQQNWRVGAGRGAVQRSPNAISGHVRGPQRSPSCHPPRHRPGSRWQAQPPRKSKQRPDRSSPWSLSLWGAAADRGGARERKPHRGCAPGPPPSPAAGTLRSRRLRRLCVPLDPLLITR